MLAFRRHAVGIIVAVVLAVVSNIAEAKYQNGIPVLLYHHVSNDYSDLPELTVGTAEFEQQIRMLHQAGFQTISPESFLAYMQGEPVELPDKPVLITFDDGYEDNYSNAFPVLRKYGFTAVIFMVGINFDRDKRLSTKQVREMTEHGVTVGGHSMTHPDLTSLTGRELAREVVGSKRKAERATGKEAAFFAYPCGFYDVAVWQAVETAGYQAAFTVLTGLNKAGRDNVYLLRRIPIYRFTDFTGLMALLDRNQPKLSLLTY